MRTKRIVHACVLSLVMSGIVAVQAFAETSLVFHWDRESGASQAVVTNSTGDLLANFPWDGATPLGFDFEKDEIEVPTLLLGELRNQLEESTAEGADVALEFIRGLMGPFADTPLEEISSRVSVGIASSDVVTEEWCGSSIGASGECVEGPESASGNSLCSAHVCKGTSIRPGP